MINMKQASMKQAGVKQAIGQFVLLALGICASSTALAATATATDSGKPLALRVQHELSALGKDGVKRDVSFGERVYRNGDSVWIEREVPASVRHAHDPTA